MSQTYEQWLADQQDYQREIDAYEARQEARAERRAELRQERYERSVYVD